MNPEQPENEIPKQTWAQLKALLNSLDDDVLQEERTMTNAEGDKYYTVSTFEHGHIKDRGERPS
jgi:hypothetical protein